MEECGGVVVGVLWCGCGVGGVVSRGGIEVVVEFWFYYGYEVWGFVCCFCILNERSGVIDFEFFGWEVCYCVICYGKDDK